MNRLGTFAATTLRGPNPRVNAFAFGGLAGSFLLAWVWFFLGEWGVSLPVTSAVLLAIIAGFLGGMRSRSEEPVDRATHLWKTVFVAAWSVALPGLIAMTLASLMWLPAIVVTNDAMTFLLAFFAAALTLSPPVFVLAGLIPEGRGAARWGVAFQGAAAAFLLAPLLLAFRFDVLVLSWSAAGVATVAALWRFFKKREQSRQEPAEPLAEPPGTQTLSPVARIERGLVALLAGAAVAVVVQMTAQLVASAAFVMYGQIAAMVSGVGCGIAIAARRWSGEQLGAGVGTALLTGSWVSLLALAYPWLIETSLSISAYVSQLWLLLPLRTLLAAAPLFPIAVGLGRLATTSREDRGASTRPALTEALICGSIGFLVIRWANVDARDAVAPFAVSGLVLALASWVVSGRPRLSRPAWSAAGAAIVLACGCFFWSESYAPARAARLLFSTQIFLAYRDGAEPEHLPFLDEGRLVADAVSDGTVWTVWKHHGSQLQFRQNGVPRHITSLDPVRCPESSSEVMPAVLGLTVHPQPRRVLMFGLGGTSPLAACTEFPVEQITCVEGDDALVDAARDVVLPLGAGRRLSDARVKVIEAAPELFAAARHEAYDVIILNENQPALLHATPRFSTAHYSRLSSALADDGLLCQRFQFVDFGPEPLQEAVATLRAVFPQVVAVETAPGEFTFLAKKTDAPLLDADFLARAQRPQVRRVMGRIGWDWSVLLTLAALSDEALDEITASSRSTRSLAAGGRPAFRLPAEMMRWAPKRAEVQEVLAPHHSRMATWLGELPQLRDVSKRLDDVTEQQRVISEQPDQFWAYRATLKSRLQDRPRSMIKQVAHEGLVRRLHPEDERRKQYLVALGEAARQENPDVASINRLLQFADPYDPLVSFFVYGEAAQLAARSRDARPDIELALRLHTINFSTGGDRSIENVVEAVELLVDEPRSAEGASERWDALNALLNVMRERWNLRAMQARNSRYAASDVEKSLAAAKAAMSCMDGLASEVGVADADWQARRDVLQTYLIRPLRTYRSSLTERKPSETALVPESEEPPAE